MTCLPQSGGCERQLTDPFVAHINDVERSQFAYMRCLDLPQQPGSSRGETPPEPETLYGDVKTHVTLVAERKTVVWPPDYAQRHKNDHLIADILLEELRDLVNQRALTVSLEPAPKMKSNELSRLAYEIAASIRLSIGAICNGHTVSPDCPRLRWSCYLDSDRAVQDEPETGLILRWALPTNYLSPERLPAEFTNRLQRLFASTVKKFRNYSDARRVLLLDPQGDVQHYDGSWWYRALKSIPVPAMIPEVWLASYGWITDYDQGWEFERIHPQPSPRYSELDGPLHPLEGQKDGSDLTSE